MRIGVIGSGFGLYGLLPAFLSVSECQVVAVCGKKTKRLQDYCKSVGITKKYTDWRLLLDNEDLDAIAIAVTPNAQYEIAKKALSKGLHVFAEKPLTANSVQAKELLFLSKKKKVTTAVDFMFPEIDEWKKVKELLGSGKYGRLKHFSVDWVFLSYDIKNKVSSWKTNPGEGGGALSFFLSHTLFYTEYFIGEIKKVKSMFTFSDEKSVQGGEVGVNMVFQSNNGVTGRINFSSASYGPRRHELIFVCEKGEIHLSGGNGVTKNFEVKVYTAQKVEVIHVEKAEHKTDEDERVVFVARIAKRFVESCITKKQMSPSFSDGYRVQKLIDIIRKSKL